MTYEEYFKRHTELIYRNVGVSMLPMLKQGRDLFILKKKTDQRCKKYDVVLYYRKPGQYVLHRIVEVHEKEYVILGDNCEYKEYGIRYCRENNFNYYLSILEGNDPNPIQIPHDPSSMNWVVEAAKQQASLNELNSKVDEINFI